MEHQWQAKVQLHKSEWKVILRSVGDLKVAVPLKSLTPSWQMASHSCIDRLSSPGNLLLSDIW